MPAKLTTQEFIDHARAVHGDKYGYAFSVYLGNRVNVMIHCREHGLFEQSPNSHLRGRGCKYCANNVQLTTQDFIEKARVIHGSEFDYSTVNYVNALSKVKITCNKHGVFEQTPASHLMGHKCPSCRSDKMALLKLSDISSFIEKASEVHGKKYDYSRTNYQHSKKQTTIVCKEHGEFTQTPNDHLMGAGCPGCTKYGFNTSKDAYIYMLRSECGKYTKIGISHSPKRRHKQLKNRTPFPFHVIEVIKGTGRLVARVENILLNSTNQIEFSEPFEGHTEWRLWSSSLHYKLLTLMEKGKSHVQENHKPAIT